MNQTLKTIAMAVTAFLFLPGVINAGDAPLPQTGSLQTPVPVVISYKKRNNNNKPKAPSMQHIECGPEMPQVFLRQLHPWPLRLPGK